MKKYLTYAIAAFFATSILAFASPDPAMIESKEKAAWQAFKDKKADDFKKVVSANMVAVYAEGMMDMQKELAEMQNWDMKSFAISDFKMTASGDTVVTTYKVKVEGTVSGQDASGNYNAASVWKQEGSDWKAIFHTNVKEEKPAAVK